MKLNKQTLIFLFVMIAITTTVKVICAPQINLSGFSAGLAVSLFAGFVIPDFRKMFLLPLFVIFCSDLIVQGLYLLDMFKFAGFYSNQWINYLLITSVAVFGMLLRKGKIAGMVAASIIGPAFFFLASNYIVWATQWNLIGYSHDLPGLLRCYAAGLPFYRNSVIATIIFLPSFLVLYQWIVKGKFSLKFAK